MEENVFGLNPLQGGVPTSCTSWTMSEIFQEQLWDTLFLPGTLPLEPILTVGWSVLDFVTKQKRGEAKGSPCSPGPRNLGKETGYAYFSLHSIKEWLQFPVHYVPFPKLFLLSESPFLLDSYLPFKFKLLLAHYFPHWMPFSAVCPPPLLNPSCPPALW